MKIDRKGLERLTTSLAVTLLSIMVIVLTLITANSVFNWDLFPKSVEKIGFVAITASFAIIFSSVIINIMLNVGRIADEFESRNS